MGTYLRAGRLRQVLPALVDAAGAGLQPGQPRRRGGAVAAGSGKLRAAAPWAVAAQAGRWRVGHSGYVKIRDYPQKACFSHGFNLPGIHFGVTPFLTHSHLPSSLKLGWLGLGV